MKLYQEHEKQYMISVAKSQEAHKLIEQDLKRMDKDALTDKGKIKSYTIDYDSVEHNPMGGFWVTVIVNDDSDLHIDYMFNKFDVGDEKYNLEISSVESVKFAKLVGD